jgi:hypothetical protein
VEVTETHLVVPLSPLIGESYQACFNIQDASLAGWTMLKDMQVDNGTKGRIVESLVIHHLVSEKKVPVPKAATLVQFRHTVRWYGQKTLPSLRSEGK